MKHDPTFWILARATGIAAYVLLTATVVAGLTLKSRALPRLRPAAITDTHRFLSLVGLLGVALHGAALVADRTIDVSLQALVVPGLVPYRPVWTGVGVVAAELMVLIHLSFRLRKRIGVRNWRRIHYLTYLAFVGATAHGLLSGTDSDRLWALGIYLLASALVAGLTVWRVTSVRAARTSPPVAAAATRPDLATAPPVAPPPAPARRPVALPYPAVTAAAREAAPAPPSASSRPTPDLAAPAEPANGPGGASGPREVDPSVPELRGRVEELELALATTARELLMVVELLGARNGDAHPASATVTGEH